MPVSSPHQRLGQLTEAFLQKSAMEPIWTYLVARLARRPVKPFVLQVGAMDGITYDPIHTFIKQYSLPALLLEPVEPYYSQLVEQYRDCHHVSLVNKALTVADGPVAFLTIDTRAIDAGLVPTWARGISSQYRDRNAIGGVGVSEATYAKLLPHIREIEVDGIAFASLAKQYAVKTVEILVIDCEGADFDILQQIPVDEMGTQLIRLEWINLSCIEKQRLKLWLRKREFRSMRMGLDIVAWRRFGHA